MSVAAVLIIGGGIYYSVQNEPDVTKQAGQTEQEKPDGRAAIANIPKDIDSLRGKKCLAGFNIKRRDDIPAGLNLSDLKLDYFESFGSGAFYGKIKNYQPSMNGELSNIINQLMLAHKIGTYEHLEADVCLYNRDLYNPQDGATLNYVVEHFYCTNSCQKGVYSIRVDLDPSGTFVGYRQGNPYAKSLN